MGAAPAPLTFHDGVPSRPLRVLVAHNVYQQRGGEDAVVDAEVALLRQNGHEVHEYRRDNADVAGASRARLAADTVWSRETVRDVESLAATFAPDVLHVHNTLPLISPSIYWAAERCGVPVVQTLHNFRLLCPQAMLLREGRICLDCVGKQPWRAVVHRCYRDSAGQSAVVAGMLGVHNALGTWQTKVSRFIALNEFCRDVFIRGGLPADKIVVKPNFVDLPPGPEPVAVERSGYLYVGRLSAEKGIAVLAEAMARTPGAVLRVAGAGPEAGLLANVPGVVLLGLLDAQAIYREMRSATALIMPSLWYENFPRTLVEAYACGLPVIASRIGALTHLVQPDVTGRLFNPGDAQDLAAQLSWAQKHCGDFARMGGLARNVHSQTLTGKVNLSYILKVYRTAIHEEGVWNYARRATTGASPV